MICKGLKKKYSGFAERAYILSEFLDKTDFSGFREKAKELSCNPDDLMDAACLAVTGALHAHGLSETIPENPAQDENGLYMMLTVPGKTK